METSYNGWPASPDKSKIGIVPLTVNGHSFPGGVKGGDVAYLFTDFLKQYDAKVERLSTSGNDEWGYAYRQNRNANNLSCHASGTAVDVNAQTHPNGKTNTLSADKVKALRAVLAVYEGVIKWGGDFSGTKDQMHYEIHGTAADVKRIADKVRKLRAPKPAPTTPAWYKRVLRRGMTGSDIKTMQARLKLVNDGDFGPKTEAAVKYVQSKHGIKATGVVDAATARAIG